MITLKGFAIVPKKISLENYYSPISEIYDTFKEAQQALDKNLKSYINPEDMTVKQVEINIFN